MISSDYLMHEGVKGMRWGVRNGPPYPIDKEKTSKYKNEDGSLNRKGLRKQKDILRKIKDSDTTEVLLQIAQVGYDVITLDLLGIAMDAVSLVNAAYSRQQRKKLEKIVGDIDMSIPADSIKVKK